MKAVQRLIHDPDHTLLRRGLRVAVVVPSTYFLFLHVLREPAAALPAAFAAFSVLAFADFKGPYFQRLQANLILGTVGTVLFAVGAVAGGSGVMAVVATFVVVFGVSFASILRGYFGAASTAVLVPWVLAVTTHVPHHLIVTKTLGWAGGALLATAGAALLWPTHPRRSLRRSIAATLAAAADVLDALAEDPRSEISDERWKRCREARDQLRAGHDGALLRPGVATSREQSLLLAYDQLNRLVTVLQAWHATPPQAPLRQADNELVTAVSATLRDCAVALRDGQGSTHAERLDAARDAHERELVLWATELGEDSRQLRHQAAASFPVRIASLSAQLLAVYVQQALSGSARARRRTQDGPHPNAVTFSGRVVLDPGQRAPLRDLLAVQLRLDSPWARTAARTAVAISLTVAVVEVTRAQYGFWVSLGALVALKLDVSGTRRTAWSVALGTLVGFAVATGLVWWLGDHTVVYWILLPVAALLAAYTPGAISLAVGQASFSVFILIMFALQSPTLRTGVIRLEDVGMGLAVSLVVSAVLWPRGVVPMVGRALHRHAIITGDYLVTAYAQLVEGGVVTELVTATRAGATSEATVASETFDLALAQITTREQALVPAWTSTLNTSLQMEFVAGVVSVLDQIDPLPVPEASGDAMLALAHHVTAEIARTTRRLIDTDSTGTAQAEVPVLSGRDAQQAMTRLWHLVDADLSRIWHDDEVAPDQRGAAALVLVFAASWMSRCVWLSAHLAEQLVVRRPVDSQHRA